MNQFTRYQPDINQLISKLNIRIKPKYRKLSQPEGPRGRLKHLRVVVTALFKYERIELNYPKADEARGYAERLISEAIRHGDSHKPTMDAASFWLEDKALVHKLFKVLAPRYENYQSSYTSLYKAPLNYPKSSLSRSLLELKGNPFPPIVQNGSRNKNCIHNVLLDEARKEFRKAKQAEIIAKISSSEKQNINVASSAKGKDGDALSKAAVDVSEGEQLLKCAALKDEDPDCLAKIDSNVDPVVV